MNPLNMHKSQLSSHSCPLIFPSSVITNTEEWGYFKALTKTPTPLEENMFHLEEGTPGPKVYLRPKESIHIPLKYQSFLCDHTMALQVEWRPYTDGIVRHGQLIKPCLGNGNSCRMQYFWQIGLYFSSQMLCSDSSSHHIFPSPQMKDQSYSFLLTSDVAGLHKSTYWIQFWENLFLFFFLNWLALNGPKMCVWCESSMGISSDKSWKFIDINVTTPQGL